MSLPQKVRAFIPHLFTLGNLFLGAWATILVIRADMTVQSSIGTTIAWMVLLAAFFDLLDGAIARKLGVASPIGGELDSLADMVTFSLLPALIAFRLLEQTSSPIPLFALLLVLAGAWRLAKFNVDTEQTTSFKGLATPASALFFLGLWAVYHQAVGEQPAFLSQTWFWYAIVPIFSFLMVCNLPMFSAKIKSWSDKETYWLYALILISVTLIALFGFLGLSLSVVTYIALSLLKKMLV